MITLEQLQAVIAKPSDELVDSINQAIEKIDLSTNERVAGFIAQMAHESAEFTATVENLNYGSNGLLSVFGKYFNSSNVASYARQPEKIANRVYANRMGNGDEASGDGFRYRGRGFIQLTGKNNYQGFSDFAGIDAVEDPDLVAQTPWNVLSAAWFWDKNGLNVYCDRDDFIGLTKRINGGTNGLEHRQAYYDKMMSVL